MSVRQQRDLLPAKLLLGVTLTVILVIALGVGIARWLEVDAHEEAGGGLYTGAALLGPPDEINAMEMFLFEARGDEPPLVPPEAEALDRWGWVDEERGVAHMPVEQAVELALEGRLDLGVGPAPAAQEDEL